MPDGYNGPGKEQFDHAMGKLLDERFQVMRHTSLCGAIYDEWERKGGDKRDLKDGLLLALMSHEEVVAEAQRNVRVLAWHGIAPTADKRGQWSFAEALEAKPEKKGAGGFERGSLASLGIVQMDGYRSGKGGNLNLSDNPWEQGTLERERWDQYFGMGMNDRPPPKPPKEKAKANGKSATQEMAEQAQAMDYGKRRKKGKGDVKLLAAPEPDELHEEPPEIIH